MNEAEQKIQEKIQKIIDPITDIYTKEISRTVKNKQELTRIILEEVSNDDKVLKIRKSLLEYHAYTVEDNAQLNSVVNALQPNELMIVKEIMDNCSKPIKQYKILLNEIATIIKSKISSEEKVNKISDLLI